MKPVTPYALERILAPSFEPVTLEDVKTYLRISHRDEDMLLQGIISVARELAEVHLNLALATQTLRLTIQGDMDCDVALPRGPVQSIVSVNTITREGVSTAVDVSTYELHVNRQVLMFDVVPQAHRIEINYVAGFTSSSVLPKPLKFGLLAHIAALYDGWGDADTSLPRESIALYTPYSEVRV